MTRANTNAWLEIGIAFLSGTIIQIPHSFGSQVTDPSCVSRNLNDTEQTSITIFCPCQHDENDIIPLCVSTDDCPDWIYLDGGLYKAFALS